MNTFALSSHQVWKSRIALGAEDAAPLATYRYDPLLPKPCLHPLVTPRGHVISGFQMADHKWHRGLWFTIKFINGTNYWEEQEPFGVQTSASEPTAELLSENTARVTHHQIWTSAATGEVIREKRILQTQRFASGIMAIDWLAELCALQDLVLDRTPFTTWGGYGGLSFRGSRELHNVNFLLPNGDICAATTGQSYDWVMMQAQVDGGPEERIALGMVDHPANPRSPSPWYCKAQPGFSYMNAAFLFHEPLKLAKGETLKFAYRTLYRDGTWSRDEFSALAQDFRKTEVNL